MKRLNIYSAFVALSGPATKEDITIQLAKQQNVRFNDLPKLQREVDRALDESMQLGFLNRDGAIYKLNIPAPPAKPAERTNIISFKSFKEAIVASLNDDDDKVQGQGDSTRNRSKLDQSSKVLEYVDVPKRRKTPYVMTRLHKNRSFSSISDKCSVCDQNFENGL